MRQAGGSFVLGEDDGERVGKQARFHWAPPSGSIGEVDFWTCLVPLYKMQLG